MVDIFVGQDGKIRDSGCKMCGTALRYESEEYCSDCFAAWDGDEATWEHVRAARAEERNTIVSWIRAISDDCGGIWSSDTAAALKDLAFWIEQEKYRR